MRIIIDGNDGVGKTTLAKRLQSDFKIKSYIHLSGKDPRNYEFYNQLLDKEDVIFDRSFLDEPVYSAVLKRKYAMQNGEFNKLIEKVKQNNIVVIICQADKKRYDKDEDALIIENEGFIDTYFDGTAKNHNFIRFNTDKGNYDYLVEVIKFLNNIDNKAVQVKVGKL